MFGLAISRRLVVLVTSITLSVLVGGIFLGVHFRSHRPSQRKVGDYALSFVDRNGRRISDAQGPLKLMLDPFTIYRNFPNQRTSRFTIDGDGYRRAYPNPGRPRIVVLGGSTAFGEQLPSDQATFAWHLGRLLGDYEVINASVVGFLSGQELAMMVHYLGRFRPAAYVVFDGWNELFDQYLFHPRQNEEFGFNNTFFMIQDRLLAFHQQSRKAEESSTHRFRPPIPDSEYPQYSNKLHQSYLCNLEKMHAFARSRGAALLVVFQPELGNKRYVTPQESESLKWWNDSYGYLDRGFPQKYARLIEKTKKFCEEQDIACIDIALEPEFNSRTETLFYDVVHLSEQGHALVAHLIHRRLGTLSIPRTKIAAGD